MAQILGFSLEELGQFSEDPVQLSTTCAVFAESELIGRITEGCSLEGLAAGVNHSVVRRLLPIITRHLPAPIILFSGGVAQNRAVWRLLETELGQCVTVLKNPQMNGAIGCLMKALQGSNR